MDYGHDDIAAVDPRNLRIAEAMGIRNGKSNHFVARVNLRADHPQTATLTSVCHEVIDAVRDC